MSNVRRPAVAGRFYPATREECVRMLDEMMRPVTVDGQVLGAVVPHAGWVYSGRTAALAISAAALARPETVVVFGAVHTMDPNQASLYPSGAWETPLGRIEIDEELAERFSGSPHIVVDAEAHMYEHSIEVQLPLIQRLMGQARIVALGVRPGLEAPEVGRYCGHVAHEAGRRVVFLASTDLTHYGPHFGFEPQGRGPEGVRWAKEVNDRRLVRLIEQMNAEAIVREAAVNHNACGAGAVAAAVAAVREAGADRYIELEHTTSAEQELEHGGRPTTSVGYEAGVFVKSQLT